MAASVVDEFFNPGAERLRRLRRMKLTATGLLVIALGLFVASYLIPAGGQPVQFLRAASEAGMVGGLADWFAVTALFRRPLGLPIPHTALIPTKKDSLAETLGGFLTEHFLDAENLSQHLESVDLLGTAGGWLADVDRARPLARELSAAAAVALESLPPAAVTRAGVAVVRLDLSRRSYAVAAGEMLEIATSNRAYEPLVRVVFAQLAVQLRDPAFVPVLKSVVEGAGWLTWLWATDRRVQKLLDRAAGVLEAAVENTAVPPWPQVHDGLLRAASGLRAGGETSGAIDDMIARQLDDPDLQAWVTEVIAGGVEAVRSVLAEPESRIADSVAELLVEVGRRAQVDDEFRGNIRRLLHRIVLTRIEANPQFFVGLITGTVARWDAEDTSRRIEIAVGRDLQFIRINGTVVGAVAGVAIHALSLAL